MFAKASRGVGAGGRWCYSCFDEYEATEVNWLTDNSEVLPTDAEKSIGNTVHIQIMQFLKYAPHFKINVVYVSKYQMKYIYVLI